VLGLYVNSVLSFVIVSECTEEIIEDALTEIVTSPLLFESTTLDPYFKVRGFVPMEVSPTKISRHKVFLFTNPRDPDS